MALTRENILAVDDLTREEVAVPEWGGSVWVRMLTARQRVELAERPDSSNGKPNVGWMAYLAASTICDESGKLLFAESDVDAIADKSGPVLYRLCLIAQRINVMTDESQKELEKNSSGEGA